FFTSLKLKPTPMMPNHFKFFLTLGFLITLTTSGFSQGVSMSPTRLFLTGNPGEKVTETVILNNSSDKDYVFNINVKDWKRELDGNKIYSEPGSLDTSNASWISTFENTVSVPAKSTQEILVTMTIPKDASPSALTNSMLFFTQISTQADKAQTQNGIGIIALFEFGLHVYYTPTGNQINSMEITAIEEINDAISQEKKIAVSVINDGNIVNDATVQFELTNTETGEEIKLDSKAMSSMPGTEQVIYFTLPTSISGQYLGVTIIKMSGTNDLRVGEKTFDF
ncbi:hypothetical protein, partial [Gelidibacter sp.]|uniref:COG1470 family protein n=1 Tax=Gelidibacter sp. TaxID=2018083 RepID=UPI003267A12B